MNVHDDLRWGAYFTTGHDSRGRFMAIISDGTPQLGHDSVTVLSVHLVKNRKAAKAWYQQALRDRPWETRQ